MEKKLQKIKRSPEISHKIMSAIKSKNTKPELLLRKHLWKEGFRYRVNYAKLPGKPDIVFTKYNIAIFCDGDFWHGHNWVIRKLPSLEVELSGYSEYWRNKIRKNIQRDSEVNKILRDMGWNVIRFWESDIKNNIDSCVSIVKKALLKLKK